MVLVAIFLSVFLGYCAVGAVVPVLPRYVHGALHAGDVALAMVMGAEALTAILGRPLAGQVGRRFGWKRLIVAGALITAAAGAGYALATSVAALMATRLLLGVGAALMVTAGGAWTVQIAPASRRGQALGLFGLSMWAGFAIGPIAGDALWRLHSYGAVWTFAVLSPLAGAAIASLVPYTHRAEAGGASSWTLFPRPVLRPGVALALAAMGYSALFTFGVLFVDTRGWTGGATMLSIFGISFVTGRAAASGLPDRFGPTRTASVAALCEAAGLLLLLVAPARELAFAGAALLGAGFSMVYPSLALIAVNGTPPAERGVAIGAFTSFFDVAVLAAGVTLGPVAERFGYGATLWVALACACGSAVLSHRTGLAAAARAVAAEHADGSAVNADHMDHMDNMDDADNDDADDEVMPVRRAG
jgi:MFS family permease